MFNASPFIYCNCVSVPVLHCSSVYSPWNCPIPTPTPGYGASLDEIATRSALQSEQGENTSEPSTSRRLKFGIENILNGTSSKPGRLLFKVWLCTIVYLLYGVLTICGFSADFHFWAYYLISLRCRNCIGFLGREQVLSTGEIHCFFAEIR